MLMIFMLFVALEITGAFLKNHLFSKILNCAHELIIREGVRC